MSRKRKKPGLEAEAEVASDLPDLPDGVPEDILAEGSGPVQAVAHVAIPTDDQEPDPPVRTKRARKSARTATAEVIEAVADELIAQANVEVVDEPAEDSIEARATAAVERAKRKKSRKSEAEVEPEPEAIEATPAEEPARRGRKKAKRGDAETTDLEASVEADAELDANVEAAVEAGADEGEPARDEEPSDEMVASADGADGDVEGEGATTEGVVGAEGVEASAEGDAAEGDVAATLPTSASALDAEQLKQLVEALVFASDKPITVQRLRQLTRVSDIPRLEAALLELASDYADRGIVLQQVSGGYQFRTRTQWSPWVQQLIAGRPVRLTRAQLETLAIIAYRQPITRPEIDDIRGVDSSATLKLLIDRSLIRILGKKEEAGRPMLYGTTKEFLDFFSLGDLRELPTLREYSELTAESRQVITDRLGDLPEGEGGESAGGDAPGADGAGLEAEAIAPEPTAADLIARYVAELDADGEADATPAAIADDAAALADAILAMDPPTDALTTLGVIDSATPEANLASAALASEAEELADAILASAEIEALAFDLSDADVDLEVDASPVTTEVTDGSLGELDPFATHLGALVARMDRVAASDVIASDGADAVALRESGVGAASDAESDVDAAASDADAASASPAAFDADTSDASDASDADTGTDTVLLAKAGGVATDALIHPPTTVDLDDEWPSSSGDLAARATIEPLGLRDERDEHDEESLEVGELIDRDPDREPVLLDDDPVE